MTSTTLAAAAAGRDLRLRLLLRLRGREMRREMPRFHVRVLRMQLPEILLPDDLLIV